jgi:hypothetical protein
MFGLTIRLWVVGGRWRHLNAQKLVQFSAELSDELWSSVGDDIAGETMKFPYVSEEELRCSLDCNGCVSGDEVGPFSCQVYQYHDCIVPMSLWEVYYEVDQYCLPLFAWDLQGLEFTKGLMSLCLGLKAEIASVTILTYVSQYLWPPVGSGDEFECLPPFQVPGNAGIVVLSDDSAMELGVLGHIDPDDTSYS